MSEEQLTIQSSWQAVQQYMVDYAEKATKEEIGKVTSAKLFIEQTWRLIIYTKETETIEVKPFWGKPRTEIKECAIAIGTIEHDSENRKFRVYSKFAEWDGLFTRIASQLAKEFRVNLTIAGYKSDAVHGIQCHYCGQYTENVHKCTFCGGKPI